MIQSISSLASIAVAVVALVIASRTEVRSHKRFQDAQASTNQIAIANVRPILASFTDEYTNRRGIYLMNYGVGTAIITTIEFRKGDKTELNLALLFEFPHKIVWDDYWGFGERNYYLRAGSKLTLARLSESTLAARLGEKVAKETLDSFLAQRDGVEIRISYQDVLGNEQVPYHRVF